MFSTSSLAVPFLQNALGIPSSKIPVNFPMLASHVLPPAVFYIGMAMLALTPQTRHIRVALWPVVALLALRAALSVDMSCGRHERKFLNIDLTLSMFLIAVRTLDWTLTKEPFVRHLRPGNKESKSVVWDAFDLAFNLRGHGWNWSRGLYIPTETRPTTNRMLFVFYTFLSGFLHALMCGALHRALLTFAPAGSGYMPEGSTIFDDTLPLFTRYLRSSIISTLTAFAVYAVLQMGYDLCAAPAVLFLGQDPAQWPPAFEVPWFSTSLNDFWSRRWHQWFRRSFILMGGYPLSLVFGRVGLVFGAFISSAVFHHIAMVALNSQADVWWMFVGFGIMGPGILAERAFYKWTGKKVGGVTGWVWTMVWLVMWGNVLVEGFARAGMFGCSSFIDSALPVRIWVEHWAANLDAWLHAI